MSELYIDGKRHWIAAVMQTHDPRWLDIFVSAEVRGRRDARHALPSYWFNDPHTSHAVVTGGHRYSKQAVQS